MLNLPRLRVAFFKTDAGHEPVRRWLKALPRQDRKRIGEEIKIVQYGWPLGMPLVRKMKPDLWDIRLRLENRIARVFFTLEQETMVLLHGFIKKDQKTPKKDLDLARRRLAQVKGNK